MRRSDLAFSLVVGVLLMLLVVLSRWRILSTRTHWEKNPFITSTLSVTTFRLVIDFTPKL
jgi:hypothetical protein